MKTILDVIGSQFGVILIVAIVVIICIIANVDKEKSEKILSYAFGFALVVGAICAFLSMCAEIAMED